MRNIEKRIDKLEERYGDKEGCKVLILVYEGTANPPEGAAEQYIENRKLCESCTRKDGLCVLYWDGENFSHSHSSR